jgi:deoxyribodipyrimidine photo-lyase
MPLPIDAALVWFRRDLRTTDHAALYHALRDARRVYCAFVFDRTILEPLLAAGRRADRRVDFIHRSVAELDTALRARGGALHARHGDPVAEIPRLAAALGAGAVYANHDYEPAAVQRDAQVRAALAADGRELRTFKDQVVFEKDEVVTAQGTPYSVFTPYRSAWLKKLTPFYLRSYPVERHMGALARDTVAPALPALEHLGFEKTDLDRHGIEPGAGGGARAFASFQSRIDDYAARRDFPAVKGPSYLSVHLRFGTVSIRALARFAWERWHGEGSYAGTAVPAPRNGAEVWLSELVWRDFYHAILHFHPRVERAAFRPEYDRIRWEDDEAAFAAWCAGRTGYPIVDAAMAQINQTGYMHNRLRMIVASFLTKDLGIDWRRGEAYFALHLNDFDLAANNGGWQWAASTGCDAQPWFRIFNPVTQSQKFDPDGRFIKRYLPQLAGFTPDEIHAPWKVPPLRQQQLGCVIGRDYPAPIVDHAAAREKTLARYSVVRGS